MGRFTTATNTTEEYNPRIAILRADEEGTRGFPARVNLYSLKDPSAGDFTPEPYQEFIFDSFRKLTYAQGFGNNLLQAGDLQGRSMRVGAPRVARITDHFQPQVVLAMPPMHVDYVQIDGASQPAVVNFSVITSTFNATYNTAQTQTDQSSATDTTSFSWARAESIGGKFKATVPFVQSIEGSTKNSWEQTNNRTVSENYNTYATTKFDASTTTVFSDVVWFTQSDFNVYYYPVLGQTVCPQATPNCAPAEQQPLYAVTSGPSQTTEYAGAGTTQEWYQPVQMPGNVFSYPWDQEQLEDNFGGDLVQLSQGRAFYTDGISGSYAATWSSGQGQTQTAGTTSTHSFKTQNSLTVGTPGLDKAESGASVTATFDYGKSTSVATLNTSTTSLGASTGVVGTRPSTFRNPGLYQYLFQPFVYGETLTEGTVQQDLQPNVDIATHGFVLADFVANPTAAAAGAWWARSPYTQYIDVGLNRPNIWASISENPFSTNLPPECLPKSGSTTESQCMIGRVPNPQDLWTSQFYWMRGLLVTVDGFDGPQRTRAVEGDTVYLQARVYNYSLKTMAPGTEVHAAFYRQPWDPQMSMPLGTSVLIEDMVVSDANGNHTIPAFNSPTYDVHGHQLPNWVLASAAFDTTGLGGRYFIFWVVVWAQDAQGRLVPELPGHGLTAKPGVVTGIGEVPLEMVTVTYQSTEQTQTTSFTNNVGFLKQAFYVALPTERPVSISEGRVKLQLQSLTVTPSKVAPNQQVVVRADVVTKGTAVDGVAVALVDEATKQIVDMDLLAHIKAKGKHKIAMPYETSSCGTHKLRVVVAPGTAVQKAKTTSLTVDCKPQH
ncbi:MAG: hypothetical protein HY268_03045 [Deltaproteobacteria bacterium]|nr:hypothetical protein [Deltaproteobacteria bacterium]